MKPFKLLWALCLVAGINFLPTKAFSQDFDDLNEQADKEYAADHYQKAIDLVNRALDLKVNARSYFIRADSKYSLKDFDGALSDYNKAISKYSEYYTTDKFKGRLYYWRARTKQAMKKWDDAISDFNTALTYNYEEPGYVYWNRANCYYDQLKYQESDDDYKRAIDNLTKSDDLKKLYKYRGDCLGHLKKYDDADRMYSKAINYDPDYYGAYWSRGYYRYMNSQDDEAIVDYKKATSIIEAQGGNSDDLASIYRNLALLYNDQKRYDDAITAINKAIKANPNYVKGFQTRADVYQNMKQYDKAKTDYTNAISLLTEDQAMADLYFDRSYKLDWVIVDYRSALDDLNKSIELDGNSGMKYWHRAITYDYKKDYAKALADINKSIELYEDDPSSGQFTLRASIKEKMGDIKGAIADYQKALKIDNKSASIYYNLGRLFKNKMNNNDLAQTNLSKAIDLSKDDESSATGAYAKVVNGQSQEAIQMVLDNIDKYQDDPYQYKWQLHNAACVYALSGNKTKALEYLDKSLDAGFDDYNHLVNDRDLVSLTVLPQYKTILAKYKVPQPKW